MADLITTGKGFKVVHLTQKEAKRMKWGIDGTGECLCSHCNNSIDPENIYYPVALNDTMCAKCYMEWHNDKDTHKYPEDERYEIDKVYELNKIFKFNKS